MSQPIIVEQESNSALLFVGGLVAVCIGLALSQHTPQATTNPVTPQPTGTQWATPQVTMRSTAGPGQQATTVQTSGEVGPQQYGNTPIRTTAHFVPENVPAMSTNAVTPKALEAGTNPERTTQALPPPNANVVPETSWKETYAPSQFYQTLAAAPSPTALGSQTIVVTSAATQAPRQVGPASCADDCKIGGRVCRKYMSKWYGCGDDTNWGNGYVANNAATVVDCTMCTGSTESNFPSGYHCQNDVCVKPPPNCFGAKSVNDCMSCGDAQRAVEANGWFWPGNEPDVQLFCSKWP